MSEYIVILATCPSKKEASQIAKALLKEKLIACANIIGGIKSFFWWKGKIDKADEAIVVIKTKRRNFPEIREKIKKLHSYEVPEIIAFPIAYGEEKYLRWINDSVKPRKNKK